MESTPPIWLQFYREEIADRAKAPLRAFGEFNPDDDEERLASICPEAGVREFEAVEGLVNKLAELKAALSPAWLILPAA
jgi:hypothetical protein